MSKERSTKRMRDHYNDIRSKLERERSTKSEAKQIVESLLKDYYQRARQSVNLRVSIPIKEIRLLLEKMEDLN